VGDRAENGRSQQLATRRRRPLTLRSGATFIIEPQSNPRRAPMDSSDHYKDINKIIKVVLVIVLILGSYNLWSFFNSSRYQALCGASFWELNRSELNSCLDQKQALDR
jgi:hypothetical protein